MSLKKCFISLCIMRMGKVVVRHHSRSRVTTTNNKYFTSDVQYWLIKPLQMSAKVKKRQFKKKVFSEETMSEHY